MPIYRKHRGIDPLALETLSTEFKSSWGQIFAAGVSEGFRFTSINSLSRYIDFKSAKGDVLTEKQFQDSVWFREGLKYFDGMNEEHAEIRAKRFDARKETEFILSHSDGGIGSFVTMLAGGFIGSIPDPLNFIPVVGLGAKAAQFARLGKVAMTLKRLADVRKAGVGGRALVSAIDASVAIGAAQPLILKVEELEQGDYDTRMAMMNVAIAAGIGTVFGTGMGLLRTLSPIDHMTATSKAIHDIAENDINKRVDVSPVLKNTRVFKNMEKAADDIDIDMDLLRKELLAIEKAKATVPLESQPKLFPNKLTKFIPKEVQKIEIVTIKKDPKTPYKFKPLNQENYSDRTFYHGSSALKTLKELDINEFGDSEGLFGKGLYTTDSFKIAKGYAGLKGETFSIKLKKDLNLLDLEKPLPKETHRIFIEIAGVMKIKIPGNIRRDMVDDFMEKEVTKMLKFMPGREIISKIKHFDMGERGEVLDDIAESLSELGFDGYRHIGGKLTRAGKEHGDHNVLVLWDEGRLSEKIEDALETKIIGRRETIGDKAEIGLVETVPKLRHDTIPEPELEPEVKIPASKNNPDIDDISHIAKEVESLETEIDSMIKDGSITEKEAVSIKDEIRAIDNVNKIKATVWKMVKDCITGED